MRDRWLAVRRRAEALPPVVVDPVIAVLCYAATVALPVKVFREGGWPLFALGGLASLPLIWRRAQPVVVAAAVGAGTVGLAVTGILGWIPLPYGQLVATYTVASLASPLWRLLVVAGTAAGMLLSVLVLLEQSPASLALAALPFVVAYAFGVGARARRDRIAMLEERARRLGEAAEAAADRERRRIAREIHDIVAHSVGLIVVQAEAGQVLATGNDKAVDTFDTISETGRSALTQLDRALGVLREDRPGRHPQPGLDDIPELLARARLAALDADLTESGDRQPVPADLGTAVYRLIQEAMTNTVRHAHARHLEVRLDWRESELTVAVRDDGVGPTDDGHEPGHGLIGMRERVQAFGGVLRTGPGTNGRGFRIAATLPLPGAGGG